MAELNNQHKELSPSYKESFFSVVQLLLAGVGIFAALSYVFGRLYINSYYYTLGISPNVLEFKPEDYMFSSLNVIIMCLLISYWLYLYWGWAAKGKRLIFGFPIAKGQTKINLAKDIVMVSLIIIWWSYLIWSMISGKIIGSGYPGILGLHVGFIIGIGMIIFAWLFEIYPGPGRKSILALILVIVVLIPWLPYVTTKLGEIEAKNDLMKFPQAVLTSQGVLPKQLQSSPYSPKESTQVRVITTNNRMTYILKRDSELTDEWQIYAIPEDDIKHIIYLHEK